MAHFYDKIQKIRDDKIQKIRDDKIQKILDFDILDFADIPGVLYIHACVHACLLAGGNVIDGASGQVIKVSLLENPYS